ncbi:PAS domain S-box protein [Corticibacter populi]|uniref:PAS domain S-box protein n=1 Tax=Corticibacter populi TaxID=1550736 RepID=A0A3M6QRP1_9BURK|nr:PAS domain S-box protein [Corticibacter populi]RMX05633.1 PAS domain S-box protein [Corticibacter populi]RZS31093.1 PAS/PAC sensor signal transduction histidine kinase [Corticibacter populi]
MATSTISPHPETPAPWRDQLRLLLDSTGEGVYGLDLQGRCMFINHAGATMLGYRPEDLIGSNMHLITHHSHADGSHYPEQDCTIFDAFRRKNPCRVDDEVFWRHDGTHFPVEYSSHPVIDDGAVVGAVVTFIDITQRRRDADALRQANETLEQRVAERTRELSSALLQVRELSAWMDHVREDERTRIAREVHDELGSMLVALKMDVNWLQKRMAEQDACDADAARQARSLMRAKCTNMGRLIEAAVTNVGRIITALRPSILDHQGLWAALEWQAQEFAQTAELALDWHASIPETLELPDDQATAVFRIFQEMLSNVGRHAQAQAIAVRMELQGAWLALSVQDDGRGAAPTAFTAPTAYGIQGMRERALHWGGAISVQSQPGAGTTLTLRLPVVAAPSAPAPTLPAGAAQEAPCKA